MFTQKEATLMKLPFLVYCTPNSWTWDVLGTLAHEHEMDDLLPYELVPEVDGQAMKSLEEAVAWDLNPEADPAFRSLLVRASEVLAVPDHEHCIAALRAGVSREGLGLRPGVQLLGLEERRWCFVALVAHPSTISGHYILCDKTTGALLSRYYGCRSSCKVQESSAFTLSLG